VATLRDQLLARRNRYLYRISRHDDVVSDEPLDDRPVWVRQFFEGGDDFPPELERDTDGKYSPAPRRRAVRLPDELRLAAEDRWRIKFNDPGETEKKKNERSVYGDWDQFVIDPWPQTDLYRMTAQIVRAIDLWRSGATPAAAEIFALGADTLPDLSDKADSVPKAWRLLELCGAGWWILNRIYAPVIKAAKEAAQEVPAFAGHADALEHRLGVWVGSWGAAHKVDGQKPLKMDPPLPPRSADPRCDCQWFPDTPAPPKVVDERDPNVTEDVSVRDPPPPPKVSSQFSTVAADGTIHLYVEPSPPTIDEAMRDAADAVVAAFNTDYTQGIVDAFRKLQTQDHAQVVDDGFIIALLLWLRQAWVDVPQEEKYASASRVWRGRYPVFRPLTWTDAEVDSRDERGNARWHQVRHAFLALQGVVERLTALSTQSVEDVAVALVKAAYQEEEMKVDHGAFDGAADRTANRPDRAFRLAALVVHPQVYLATFNNFSPANEFGDGADGFARPEASGASGALSAFYWRNVVMTSTMREIFRLNDTADFHVASHLRFIGLFRRGGEYRPARRFEARQGFDEWIQTLVPDWFLKFAQAAVLRFKYWIEDPPTPFRDGDKDGDEMSFWSENHQIIFGSSEYIAGLWWPNDTFTHAGKSGQWHRDRAYARVETWLLRRLKFGFSEVNSGTYYNQHLPALFNLADFAHVPEDADVEEQQRHARIQTLALMVLDVMFLDIVRRTCQGSFVAASGRSYWGSKCSGWSTAIPDLIEVLTGTIGDTVGWSENAAVCFCTSRYVYEIPECLIALGIDHRVPIVDRSRTSIDLSDAETYGIEYDTSKDIVFWWGCSAYLTEKTYNASQSWSYRWHLRNSGVFKLFELVDEAFRRLVLALVPLLPPFSVLLTGPLVAVSLLRQAVVGAVAGAAYDVAYGSVPRAGSGPSMVPPSSGFVGLISSVMLTPFYLRTLLDLLLAILDVLISLATSFLKEVNWLDENDDRVRVARPAFEQAFRNLAITLNAGSILGRQRVYTWRSQDAMLSSLVDDTKGETSAQKEACIANLGMNVSVFTGKRMKKPEEFDSGETAANAIEGFGRGVVEFGYDPEVFGVSQVLYGKGQPAPHVVGAFAPIIIDMKSKELFGEDGPKYWFGYASSPLVFQHENVAISIYSPTELQQDFSPEETHAHWPWDQFDAVRTDERSGGRWVFGRRARRFPPRTPCRPRSERRPSDTNPWPRGDWRKERLTETSEPLPAGYVALFSARGFKSFPAEMHWWEKQWQSFAHRELIADGDDNIFVTIVGDQSTYHSFEEFRADVLAGTLSVDVKKLRCSIRMPVPGSGKSGSTTGALFEVDWDEGGTVDGTPIDTSRWPRFEFLPSSIGASRGDSDKGLVESFRITSGTEPRKNRVDWDETSWRIEATVHVWRRVVEQTPDGPRESWKPDTFTTSMEHDFSDEQVPARRPSPPAPDVTVDLRLSPQAAAADVAARSLLGREFRSHHIREGRRS
jgi:hypothetical protein